MPIAQEGQPKASASRAGGHKLAGGTGVIVLHLQVPSRSRAWEMDKEWSVNSAPTYIDVYL